MAERSVSNVVQQGREPSCVSIHLVHPWYVCITVEAEISSMAGIPLKGPDHTFCGFYNPPGMLEAIMPCTGINEVRHPKLTDSTQPLKQGRVQKQGFPR